MFVFYIVDTPANYCCVRLVLIRFDISEIRFGHLLQLFLFFAILIMLISIWHTIWEASFIEKNTT